MVARSTASPSVQATPAELSFGDLDCQNRASLSANGHNFAVTVGARFPC
jgi:hypothetical protein